jgi:NAD kinase
MFEKVFVAWKKDYGENVALRVCSVLRELGVEYVFDEPKGCDLAIMVGGDGTLLNWQSSIESPILGINPGKSVGYYMPANNMDFRKKLRSLMKAEEGKGYFIREYPRLETRINKTRLPFLALNDVLVSPIFVRRVLYSDLRVKGERTREVNSGVIIYTPSGSHAYAKSVGAKPLKDPKKLGVAAIAPYTGRLTRGEIISKGNVVVRCLNWEGEVCIDGQEDYVCRLKENDVVTVRKSEKPTKIIWFGRKRM